MSNRTDIWIKRATSGTIQWEDWWVRRHGQNLKKIPTEEDQVSFANFDLTNNGYPRISRIRGELVVVGAREDSREGIEEVLAYHGFSIVRITPSTR